MTAPLSRRLGAALGTHEVTPAERWTVAKAAESSGTWEGLPKAVRALVAEIESRPAAGARP